MELILVSVVIRVNLNVISIVDLLIDVFIHLCRNIRFVSNSNVQSADPLCCTKIILAKTWKVWFVETINLNLALDGSTTMLSMMAWMFFSLVIMSNCSRLEGVMKSSAEVRRRS